MKVQDFNLLTTCIMVAVVLSKTAPSRSQQHMQGIAGQTKTSRRKYDSEQFPALVESRDHDFVVKWRGDIFSWKNLSQLLRQHNITVPDERSVLPVVLRQKNSRYQSCQGRCFLDERRFLYKTCFCDKACKTFGDCCLDFHSRCGETSNDASFRNMICGDVNDPERPWSGVIMKSICGLHNRKGTNDCQTVQRLDMALEKELPVFDWTQNVTYRSIACARCNSGGNLSFWGLGVSCAISSGAIATPVNITAVKTFLKEYPDCSWKYAPRNGNQRYKSCVLHDAPCASNSNHLRVLSVVKELCSLYSMVFSTDNRLRYRNPHCALCNLDGRPLGGQAGPPRPENQPIVPPLSILLDVSASIPDPKDSNSNSNFISHFKESTTHEPKDPPPKLELIMGPPVEDYNLTSDVLNCTSNTTNCTVTFQGYNCENFTSVKNQSTQMRFSLNKSHAVIIITQKQLIQEKKNNRLQENSVYILCPVHQTGQSEHGGQVDKDPKWNDSAVPIYVTFTGTLLSIVSLCFLLSVYLCFKELRNLPGKCLISLSVALLCYQAIFLGAAKSREVDALCKVVAIFLHFFLLAAFSWMSVMAFDTARTFTVKVTVTRRQPSDIRKTFIKYCLVGWGLPVVVIVLCSVLEFTGTFHFGYGNVVYCWISDKKAIAVALVTPVSLSLVFNLICLSKSVYAIRHLQQGASQATNNSSRASLTRICIQLTTVMGLTWILGLLANWNQTALLQYPSTVLNSMQGFFIALCFTTTKKVRGILKDRLFKRWNGRVEPSHVVQSRFIKGLLFA